MRAEKNNTRTKQLIAFMKEIASFTAIERRTLNTGSRLENDAEHSWHVAMFLIIFDRELPKTADRLKMLKMALIHDLAELYAGDTFAFDKTNRKKTKKIREQKAAKRLFKKLPNDLRIECARLLHELESKKTTEAKIVESFDKLQPILKNILSKGGSWKQYGIGYQEVDKYKRHLMTHHAPIEKLYQLLMSEAKRKRLFPKIK